MENDSTWAGQMQFLVLKNMEAKTQNSKIVQEIQ